MRCISQPRVQSVVGWLSVIVTACCAIPTLGRRSNFWLHFDRSMAVSRSTCLVVDCPFVCRYEEVDNEKDRPTQMQHFDGQPLPELGLSLVSLRGTISGLSLAKGLDYLLGDCAFELLVCRHVWEYLLAGIALIIHHPAVGFSEALNRYSGLVARAEGVSFTLRSNPSDVCMLPQIHFKTSSSSWSDLAHCSVQFRGMQIYQVSRVGLRLYQCASFWW